MVNKVRRVATWTAKGIGLVLALVALVFVGALAALQTRWGQRYVAQIASEQADKALKGRVEVRLEGSLSLFGLSEVSVSLLPEDVRDAAPLVVVSNLRAGWDLWALLRSLVGSQPLVVGIDAVEVESLLVDLRKDPDGELALNKAVALAEPSGPEPESTSPTPYVNLEQLDIFDVRILMPPTTEAPPADAVAEPTAQQVARIDRVHATFDMRHGMFATVTASSVEAPIPGQARTLFGDLSAAGYMDESNVPTANARFDGEVDGVRVALDALYDDGSWVTRGHVDGAQEAWRSAVPGFEPTQPVSADLVAVGDLTAAEADVRARAGRSLVGSLVEVRFDPLVISGDLDLRRVDANAFASAAPTGLVDARATFQGQLEPQSARVQLEVRNSLLEGNSVPDFDLRGTWANERGDFDLKAVDNSGLHLEGFVSVQQRALGFAIRGAAKRLPEYSGTPQLSAFDVRDLTLDAEGTLHTEAKIVDATLKMYVDGLAVPSAAFTVGDLSAEVSAKGSLQAPLLDGNIVAHTLTVGDVSAAHLRLHAVSQVGGDAKVTLTTRTRLSKDAVPRDIALNTSVVSLSPFTAMNTELRIADEERTLLGSVAKLHAGERTEIAGIRVSGVGELGGDAVIGGDTLDAKLRVAALDLGALSHLFSPLVPRLTGQLTANLGITMKGQRLTAAHVFARANGVGVEAYRADELESSLVVKRDLLSGTLSAGQGQTRVRLDLSEVDIGRVRRSLATPEASPGFHLNNFRGGAVATVVASSSDFPELERKLGEIHTSGVVQSQVILRHRADSALSVSSVVRLLDVSVRKVEPALPERAKREYDKATDQALTAHERGWEVSGLTAELVSSYDGTSGEWSSSLAASEQNRAVPILRASMKTTLPVAQLDEHLASRLQRLPIDGVVVIPSTTLDSLPGSSFLPTGIDASVAADLTIRGTLSSPNVVGSLRVEDLQVSANNDSFPVSLLVQGAASKAKVEATVELTHQDLVLVTGSLDGVPEKNEWRTFARVDKLPLGRLPYVRDYGVTGIVSGEFKLDGSAANPSLMATMEASDVAAYGEILPKVTVSAKLQDGDGELVADVQQRSGGVYVTATAASPSGQLPDYRPRKLKLEARSFQIRPLLVAMQDAVSDLSGKLDGLVEVTFAPGSTAATGKLKLSEGLILVPALGKHIHDAKFTIEAAPGKLQLTDLDAKVERGEIRGSGNVSYTPAGKLMAELNLELPKNRRLPISNKGRNVAEASGRVGVRASLAPGEDTKIDVDVPELDVYFSDTATDKVMSTESPTFVALGTYLPDGHYVRYASAKDAAKVPSGPGANTSSQPTLVTVNLGKKVWLHHGTSTFAGIDGQLVASIDETTRLSGALNLAEGRIDIQGRVFDIRPGTVVFHGESPPNPDVVAEAAWTSPSGYTVIATYRGSVTNGKVVLRSEPPLSYGEILNVLLFDDPEGSGGSDGSPGAGDVAATVASAGLSKSLTSLTDLDVQASMDTDAAGSPRPELGVRLTPRLAVEVAYVLEPSAALSQPPDRAFVSFDWRLSNAWTLETTLGDHGSAATDVTWKYRY